MMHRALVLLLVLVAASANAKVGGTTLADLFHLSDRVVIGKIVKIETRAGRQWARVEVAQTVKGAGAGEILFLAEPTWTCDTSSATVGDEALLFLDAEEELPANAFHLAWSGRGQLPLRYVEGERFVTVSREVAIPEDLRGESLRLTDLLAHLKRMNQATLETPGGEVVITLEDAKAIRAAVETYLKTAKPKLETAVSMPEDPVIDFTGTVRMGAWFLEASYSSSDLYLTYPFAETRLTRHDQLIVLRRVGDQWEAYDAEVRTAHRRY